MSFRGRGGSNNYRGRGGYQRSGGGGYQRDGMEIEGVGNNNNNNGFSSRVTGPGEQLNQLANQAVQQNSVPVEVRGWQGGSRDDLVSFISRKTRIPLMNAVVDGDVIKGYVKDSRTAQDLKRWSGVKFAGNSLKIDLPVAGAASSIGGGSPIDFLKAFLHRRYNAQAKLLDLTNIASDQDLQRNGAFSSISVQSKMFPALMKLVALEKFDIESVNLSENNLEDLQGVTTLAQTLPNLKNLALTNNKLRKLRSFEIWKNKLKNLRELIVVNNPVTTDPQYKDEISKIFPRLVILDGVIIRDETKLSAIYQFPLLKKQFFFEDQEIQTLSTQFISNFLNFWDSDRSQLLPLYSPQSQFSISVDSSVPNDSSPQQVSFGYYIPISRNLSRVSSERTRQQRLGIGSEEIFKIFQNIPKTKHTLQQTPERYSMESWRLPQLSGFIISLHGEYEEISQPEHDANGNRGTRRGAIGNNNSQNKLTKKSFDRTFVVVPANGSMIIASDLLSIRPFANHDAFIETSIDQSSTQTLPQSQPTSHPPSSQGSGLPHDLNNGVISQNTPNITPTPSAGAGAQSLPPPPPPPIQQGGIPQELVNLQPGQQEFITRLHQETKLNLQFSLLLAEQSQWNYDVAIEGFKVSHSQGQIPQEAFM